MTAVLHAPAPAAASDPAPPAPTAGGPPIDPDLWSLHLRLARTGDADALHDLVAEYHGHALSLARRHHRSGEPLDDLRQVALEALVVALRRFDPTRRLPFVAFATPTIVGALRRHYRDHGWALRVPRLAHDLAAPLRRATEDLAVELGRRPTRAEVAGRLGHDEAVVATVEQAVRARVPAALPAAWRAGADDPALAAAESRIDLRRALAHLGDRDRDVLGLYFGHQLTQAQIADRYGVSQMQVSRWIARALCGLRRRMVDGPEPG